MEDIQHIYSSYEVDARMKVKIPKEKLEEIIKNNLSRILADFIMQNMDKLPVSRRVEQETIIPVERHTIEVTLISDTELRRLKATEADYNRIIADKFRDYAMQNGNWKPVTTTITDDWGHTQTIDHEMGK